MDFLLEQVINLLVNGIQMYPDLQTRANEGNHP
jgi:hypothetical protein